MDAVIWAALGILTAATFGNLYYLGSKIDGLGARLDAKIDGLDAKLTARIDALSGRIDGLSARLDAHVAPHAG